MSSASDSEIYSGVKISIENTFGPFYYASDKIFVLAISRKGPRQLESIFREQKEKKSHLNILTELALPYFFNSLKASSIRPSVVYLYDDAVYYGTTIESVYREIEEYMNYYNIHFDVKPYTGVLTSEAKDDLFFQIEAAVKDVRKGYGHYFIRRLTQDIRSLQLPFELEFPIIYYQVKGANFFNPDIKDQMISSLKKQYGESKVYEVGYFKESVYNITILLNSDGDLTSINKIRIYPSSDGYLTVTCMSPYILPNSNDVFQEAWRNTMFQDIWQTIYRHSIPPNGIISEDVERNRRKSLVSFYSYLNSLRVFLNRKRGLVASLCEVFGSDKPELCGFKEKDLFYLFGDAVLCKEVCGKLREIYSSYDESKITLRKIIPYPAFSVYEIPDFPTYEERQRLEFKNIETIKKCASIQQALSVLFFNQNCLVEKWSRRHTRYDQKRLRFGQTFESLFQNVKVLQGLSDNQDTVRAINKWVDRRIDQGCVVPQYIMSHNDGRWYRVFRPGENEDAVLSHLTRIVLLVFTEARKILGEVEFEKSTLEYLMSVPFMRKIDICLFSDALGLSLQSTGECLLFRDDDSNNFVSVLNYLLQAGVLESKDKKILVSKTLGDEELSETTTLDIEVENTFRKYVDAILQDMKGVDAKLYYTIFNFYTFIPTDEALKRRETSINIFCDNCDNTLLTIEKSLRQASHVTPMDIFNSLISDYTTIRSLQMHEKYFLDNPEMLQKLSEDKIVQSRTSTIQKKLLQLRGIYELIIYSFVYTDYSSLRLRFDLYLNGNKKRGLLFGELREIETSLNDEDHFNSKVWDRHTVLSYRYFINKIIRYQSS